MPAPPKGSAPANSKTSPAPSGPQPEQTVAERTRQRLRQTNPLEEESIEVGFAGLSLADRKKYAYSRLIQPVADRTVTLSTKTEREFWKQVNKDALPPRRLTRDYDWGKDKNGRHLSSYTVSEFEERRVEQAKLATLELLHQTFLARRQHARNSGSDFDSAQVDEERQRRTAMAALKSRLYGEYTGPLANDPDWDDVIPLPQDEPSDALARIAYPDDYAEAVSYLRAVMAAEECSPRCLRLTEHVVSMNPAHYTVWLYRFKVLCALGQSIPEEVEWLNDVAMTNLKNYQIWHHRQLLMDHYIPTIASDDEALKQLAKSETDFIADILTEDTKNYHVWSYRQYLVRKLCLWTPAELGATQSLIEDDVRNNSAWSHRFFVVFSDPSISTPDLPQTEHDPAVPETIIDRETNYAKEKVLLAPQNQSSWNYLRGVVAKGGRSMASLEGFASQFVTDLGGDVEAVRSSHALDLLAEACHERGDDDRARLCLRRLWEKWDPIREGYWKHRAAELGRGNQQDEPPSQA